MADKTLEQGSNHSKLTEAAQARAYARVAQIYDWILSDVASVLQAIDAADLFGALPPDEADRARHNVGSILLSNLTDRVSKAQEEIEAASGTDLFIYLDARALELAKFEAGRS